MTRSRYSGSGDQITGNTKIANPGDDLQLAYDLLKNDGSMGTASDFNRRVLLLSPGHYLQTSTFVIDDSYTDVAGLSDERRSATIEGPSGSEAVRQDSSGNKLSGFTVSGKIGGAAGSHGFLQRQYSTTGAIITDIGGGLRKIAATGIGRGVRHLETSTTLLTTTGDYVKVVGTDADGYYELVVNDTHLTDDSVVIDASGMSADTGVTVYLGAGTNSYTNMHFTSEGVAASMSCIGDKIYSGNHYNCTGDSYAFRGFGPFGNYANFYDCHAGFSGFIGDATNAEPARGEYIGCTAGDNSFSGCVAFSTPIGVEAKFISCTAGDRSFGLSTLVEGTFISCVGGDDSFAGNLSQVGTAIFAGTAIGCIIDGVGGFTSRGDGGDPDGYVSGLIKDCIIPALAVPIHSNGATFEGANIENTAFLEDAIKLQDDNTSIYNCRIKGNTTVTPIGLKGGTAAADVKVAHCRINGTGTGLAAGVINLIGTPYNVIDTDV